MMDSLLTEQLHAKLVKVTALLKDKRYYICTAESCTGGKLAMLLTELAGSSDWFERGFVTYSNDAKTSLLGVKSDLIASNGAVSEPVALAMAKGALIHSNSDIAVAITGIAGPGGETPGKPVGTVCFAVADRDKAVSQTHHFKNQNRQTVRVQSCLNALTMIEQFVT